MPAFSVVEVVSVRYRRWVFMKSAPSPSVRTIRAIYYSPWANRLEKVAAYLRDLPQRDLSACVTNPNDPSVMRLGRLDCDWDGENLRALAAMNHPHLQFQPMLVVGMAGLADLAKDLTVGKGEESWLILTAQKPQQANGVIGQALELFTRQGGRVLYWAYDQASVRMPCFAAEVAPHLSVLIHDEIPLAEPVSKALRPACHRCHRSWVANMVPLACPFAEKVDEVVMFLGSQMGLTPARQQAVDFLKARLKDRFTVIVDHSASVAERGRFARYKAHLCPEGRMFTSFEMRLTHTDRPFWAGCLGQIPVVEDSHWGGRLEPLFRDGMIFRYPHGNLEAMAAACEQALAAPLSVRRRIYDHFNANETIGTVVAQMIAAAAP
jgi:hypothetical protein